MHSGYLSLDPDHNGSWEPHERFTDENVMKNAQTVTMHLVQN